jgi:hypothetical protein
MRKRDVDRLIRLSADLPVITVPLDEILDTRSSWAATDV